MTSSTEASRSAASAGGGSSMATFFSASVRLARVMRWPTAGIASELTIGELSERSGVSASALRFYERQGLIASRRTTGNQRRYHRTTLRRVAFIRASQSVGIPRRSSARYWTSYPRTSRPPKSSGSAPRSAGARHSTLASRRWNACATASRAASAAAACHLRNAPWSTRTTRSPRRGPARTYCPDTRPGGAPGAGSSTVHAGRHSTATVAACFRSDPYCRTMRGWAH